MSNPLIKIIVTADKKTALKAKEWLIKRTYRVGDDYPVQCSEVSWEATTAGGSSGTASDHDDEVWMVIGVM